MQFIVIIITIIIIIITLIIIIIKINLTYLELRSSDNFKIFQVFKNSRCMHARTKWHAVSLYICCFWVANAKC